MLACLHELSPYELRALAASLRSGVLAVGTSTQAMEQVVGTRSGNVARVIEQLRDAGWSAAQMSTMLDAIAEAKAQGLQSREEFELVLSGPEIPGMPTADTAAVVRSMIESAHDEILLVGYAVHNGKRLFEPLAQRMRARPSLNVRFCLDIARKFTDTSLASEIVRRFGRDFRERHWPWPDLPEVFHDPRALADTPKDRASLHAKCVVVDRKQALVTSANFTQAAQERNLEIGVLVRDPAFVNRLAGLFDVLIATGTLQRCRL